LPWLARLGDRLLKILILGGSVWRYGRRMRAAPTTISADKIAALAGLS
jgi:hypothetical protein